jgi:hypothetical protein
MLLYTAIGDLNAATGSLDVVTGSSNIVKWGFESDLGNGGIGSDLFNFVTKN